MSDELVPVVESGNWHIKKRLDDNEDVEHYVIGYDFSSGPSRKPFDEVTVSDGVLHLEYNGDVMTKYSSETNMPEEIYEQLMSISSN